MILEVYSIAYVTTVNLLIIALAFFTQWLREREPSLRIWSLGFLLGALGSEVTSLRGEIADFYTVAVGSTLMLLAYVYAYLGLCRLFGTRPRRSIWLLPALTLALFGYFTVIDSDPFTWPLITGYMRVVICIIIFVKALRHRAQMSAYSSLLLLLSMSVMGLFMFGRATWGLWTPQSYNFSTSNGPAITYFLTAACTLAMMMGLMSLYVEKLLGKLERAANTDVLTGLNNRRFFNELAHVELDRSIRERRPLWLLMIDIDHFKDINDTLGHAEGDCVLRSISHVLRESLRSYDIVARYGGEEFCVLLPNTEAAEAQNIAQRLLQRVAALQLGPQQTRRVTISIGATARSNTDCALDDILKRADHALYEAKRNGRNAIVGFDRGIPFASGLSAA